MSKFWSSDVCCDASSELSRGQLECDGTRAETRFRLLAKRTSPFNPSNTELNPICHLMAFLGAHHILYVSRVRVKSVGASKFWASYAWCDASSKLSRGQLKCDGTRAETRFRLLAKRTSPFKSAVASFQSTSGSRGVRISCSNAGYTMFRGSVRSTGYPLHSPVPPFTSSPVRHLVPSHFNWSLPTDVTGLCAKFSLPFYLAPGIYAPPVFAGYRYQRFRPLLSDYER
jgi:hypothetical protein